jgi:hypothetical protein
MDIRPEKTFADFYMNNGLIHTPSCPFVEQNCISREIVKRVSCLISFIIECIREANYIYVLADISKISTYSLNTNKNHEIFIYGFDINQEQFFMADYVKGKYIQYTASFTEVEEAINDMDNTKSDHLNHIEMWRILPKSNYSFDIIHVRNQLFEYVNCINSSDKYRQKAMPYSFRVYGSRVYEIILNHVQNVKKMNVQLDKRIFHLLYIRCKIMLHRLEYMKNNGCINNISDYFDSYLTLTKLVEINSNLALKYQQTKNESLIFTIQSNLQKIYVEDRKLSEKLLNLIDRLMYIK